VCLLIKEYAICSFPNFEFIQEYGLTGLMKKDFSSWVPSLHCKRFFFGADVIGYV